MVKLLANLDKKILIVEDSISMRLDLVLILNSMGLINIIETENGQEGLRELLIHANWGTPIDIIFSDINMPKMNGINFLKEVRKSNTYHSTPIFMVSTVNERPTVIKAIMAGATDYILKPYDAELVREKLIKHIRF
jgi:two-component system chemotaxis response regulator CheY